LKTNKISLSSFFIKAPFPAAMTVVSLLLFIALYLFINMTAIEPYFLAGLFFAVPFLCFGAVACAAAASKISPAVSNAVTCALLLTLGFAMPAAFGLIALDAAATVTTDAGKYETVLKRKGYPNDPLTSFFPETIPDSAKNPEFRYNPAFMQGSEDIALKFETDSDAIENLTDEFSKKARWTGKAGSREAEKHGIFTGTFPKLPEDAVVYVFFSRPYRADDWNHGRRGLAVVSRQHNEVLFLASDW